MLRTLNLQISTSFGATLCLNLRVDCKSSWLVRFTGRSAFWPSSRLKKSKSLRWLFHAAYTQTIYLARNFWQGHRIWYVFFLNPWKSSCRMLRSTISTKHCTFIENQYMPRFQFNADLKQYSVGERRESFWPSTFLPGKGIPLSFAVSRCLTEARCQRWDTKTLMITTL